LIGVETEEAVTQYTLGLAKGGALLPETRILLEAWQTGEDLTAFGERVLRDDLLGRSTARRIDDIVRRCFAARFLTPDDAAARHMQCLIQGAIPRQLYTDLVFFYTAQHEHLLRDAAVTRYWPSVRSGSLTIGNSEVYQLLVEAERDGRILRGWSDEIKRDMAGRVLIALTEFGLLAPLKPGRREVLPYRPIDGTVVYLTHLLHFAGVTDASLAVQPQWALFGLEPRDVWNRLDMLAGEGWFILQRAGSVVRIAWKHVRMEEVVDVLAGR
jgi:hypothetical protein